MSDVVAGKTAVMLDEHPLWLQAMAEVLDRQCVALVGSATETYAALKLVEAKQPDIFVMTLEQESCDIDGYECLRRARVLSPTTHAVVVSSDDDPGAIELAFALGATAFCSKSAEPDELGVAIRQSFARSIHLNNPSRSIRQPATSPGYHDVPLTLRQTEILRLVSEGHSNSQVARMLWVTEQTVKFHLSNIYRRLEVANRTEASRWAQLHGLLAERRPDPRRSAKEDDLRIARESQRSDDRLAAGPSANRD